VVRLYRTDGRLHLGCVPEKEPIVVKPDPFGTFLVPEHLKRGKLYHLSGYRVEESFLVLAVRSQSVWLSDEMELLEVTTAECREDLGT
jgi:hypothetical protein